MSIFRKAAVTGATLISLATMVGAAAAAQATTALNIRSGPSTSYGVVDTLYRGEQVNVRECNNRGWCRIEHSGPDGWVSARYLTDTGSGNSQPTRPSNNSEPDVNFSFSVPGGFSFSFGNGGNFPQRPPQNNGGKVCFYENFNYRGASFCVNPGQRFSALNNFNDRISSIRVFGNAEAQVCENNNYRGRCAIVSESQPRLNRRNNDIISSIRVR